MFTGIIQKVGHTSLVEKLQDASRLCIETGFDDLEIGESVAVNGVCLTVTETDLNGSALFFVSLETLNRTNLADLRVGAPVNLERAISLSTRLSGHLVQGHVDGLASFESARRIPTGPDSSFGEEDSFEMTFRLPAPLARYCIEKGSIALNGTSLTINSIEDAWDSSYIHLMLIPHTWKQTNLSALSPGDDVNVEVDVLAKYVERLTRGQNHVQTQCSS